MIELRDPREEPSVADKLTMGADCYRGPLGNIIAQNGTSADEQTANWLRSLRKSNQITDAEAQALWLKYKAADPVAVPAPVWSSDRRPLQQARPQQQPTPTPDEFAARGNDVLGKTTRSSTIVINPGTRTLN